MKRRRMDSETWERMRLSRNKAVKKRRERLKALGLCVVCGRPRGEFTLCEECYEKYRANRLLLKEQRYKKGLCVVCGKRPHRPNVLTCYICGLKASDSSLRSIRRRNNNDT